MAIDSRVGTDLAGYRIESVLGRGGMSVVYLAEDRSLHRRVALKVLAPDLARDERFRGRFIRESEMAAGIDHPNIVPIYQAGEADGLLFIAMRYIRGSDLKALIETEGRLDAVRVVSILRQAANALDAAHAQGLVHRDVKPANLLLAPGPDADQPDQVYLSDFGLTKRPTSRSGLTNTGQFIGTVDYMAPEQIEGKSIDGRVDVYSLGCVLYECLTGDVPYPKDNEVAVIYAHLQEPAPSVAAVRPELPPGVDEVIASAMAKDPDARYPTCSALATAARTALVPGGVAAPSSGPSAVTADRPPVNRRPTRRTVLSLVKLRRGRAAVLGAFVVLALAVGGVIVATRNGAPTAAPTHAATIPRGLARIDPKTNRVAARVSYQRACCVTLVGGTVWADGPDGLIKISPTTNQVVATLSDVCCPSAWQGELWGSTDDEVVRIDPRSNKVIRPLHLPGLPVDGSVVDDRVLWLFSTGAGRGVALDKRTGRVLGRVRINVASVDGAAAGDGAVWISDRANNRVERIDAKTHEVKDAPVQHPSGITVGPGGIWVVDAVDGVLTELSADGGALLAAVNLGMSPGDVYASLAIGAGSLWINDKEGGVIIRVDLTTHKIVARIPVGPGPQGVAADDQAVWVTR